MTVIENINIAYVSQDLSLLSSADADGTKDLRYLSVFAIGCMILPLREDRRNCLFNGWVNSFSGLYLRCLKLEIFDINKHRRKIVKGLIHRYHTVFFSSCISISGPA